MEAISFPAPETGEMATLYREAGSPQPHGQRWGDWIEKCAVFVAMNLSDYRTIASNEMPAIFYEYCRSRIDGRRERDPSLGMKVAEWRIRAAYCLDECVENAKLFDWARDVLSKNPSAPQSLIEKLNQAIHHAGRIKHPLDGIRLALSLGETEAREAARRK